MEDDYSIVSVEEEIVNESEETSGSEEIINETKESGGRKSTRIRKQPEWLSDYEVSASLMQTGGKENPLSYKEAVESAKGAQWKAAMDNEMSLIRKNEVWELVKRPEKVKVIENKWVFTTKTGDNNELKYKARLVVKGFMQEERGEAYSPVAKMSTVRIVANVASVQGWSISQMDVKTAFLNGTLNETVYMEQPKGYDRGGGLVCCSIRFHR